MKQKKMNTEGKKDVERFQHFMAIHVGLLLLSVLLQSFIYVENEKIIK